MRRHNFSNTSLVANSVLLPKPKLSVKQFCFNSCQLISLRSGERTLEDQISISDNDRFDNFTRHIHNIKSAIMNSKPRNGDASGVAACVQHMQLSAADYYI